MQVEKTEFTFPDENEVNLDNPRKGGTVVEPDDAKQDIEVVDDTPEKDRNRRPMAEPPKELTDEELNKYDEKVKSRIQHFTKGYHEERRAKEAAQREKEEALRLAQSIVEENKQLRGSLSQGHNALLEQAKRVVANELDTAKRKFKEAAESFDSEAMLVAQEELTAAKIKADKIENFRPESLQPPKSEVQIPQPQTSQPVDEKLESWKEQNQWFGANKRMTAYALGLHEDLVAEGVPVGSDTYYKRLNVDIRKRFPEQFDEVADDAPTRRSGSVVAPATRSTAPKKIVLTQSQVNIAKRLGVPLELYAKKVAEALRN